MWLAHKLWENIITGGDPWSQFEVLGGPWAKKSLRTTDLYGTDIVNSQRDNQGYGSHDYYLLCGTNFG